MKKAPHGNRPDVIKAPMIGSRMAPIKNIAISTTIQVTSIACGFLVNVIVARELGVAAQGTLQVAITWLLLLSTLGRLGLDQVSLRSMAEEKVHERTANAHRILARNLKIAAIPLSLLAIVGASVAPLYGATSLGFEAITVLQPVMLSILPLGLLFVISEGLRGWQLFNTGALLLYATVWALLSVALLCAAPLGLLTTKLLGWLVLAAHASALIIALIVWMCRLAEPRAFVNALMHRSCGVRGAIRSAFPFYVNAVAFSLMTSIDVVILSMLASAEELGLYSAVLRSGGIIGSSVVAASFWISPKIALLYARGEHAELHRVLRDYLIIVSAGSPLIALFFFLFADEVMLIWGQVYVSAAPLLQVYVMFQLFNLVFGIFYYVVLVTGAENAQMRISVAVLILKVIGVTVGYKLLGIWGALLATGVAVASLAAAAAMIHWRRSKLV